jgi:2-polyprenyl-3-methyl-5-hydroxy-6-metoxy-1,4-benzoquinol methylase
VEGVAQAKANFPELDLHVGSTDDDLTIKVGRYSFVYALEVLEHVLDPWKFMDAISELVKSDGYILISTPYHGYVKNLLLSIFDKWDGHFTALWRGGHIKFWSYKTLTTLLVESGFQVVDFEKVGRIKLVPKSMILVAKKIR